MPRPRNTYVPGDHVVVCDRSGFRFLRSECRLEWTGALVAKKYWEGKHPQLEIRSVKDDQSVRDARPDRSSTFVSTTTSASSSKEDKSLTLSSVSSINNGTSIGITLDDSEIQWTFATADPVGSVVSINEGLLDDVESGNTVYLSDNSTENYINLSDEERRALL